MANHSFIGLLTSWLSEQHSNYFTPHIFLPTDVTCTILNFDEKVSEILVGCNEGKGCNYLCDLLLDFEEAWSFFKLENFY